MTVCIKNKPLMLQIIEAFEVRPDIAGTLHGSRRVIQGQRGKSTSLFPSQKCGGAVPLESRLELAHALILESMDLVKSYRTQAIYVPLSKSHHMVPDFLVQMNDGSYEVHEVKPSIVHLSDQECERFDFLSLQLGKEGVVLRLVDATTLPSRKETNLQLYLFSRGHVRKWNRFQTEMALNVLSEVKYMNLGVLHKTLSEKNLPHQLAEYLIFHKKIVLDDIGLSLLVKGHVQ